MRPEAGRVRPALYPAFMEGGALPVDGVEVAGEFRRHDGASVSSGFHRCEGYRVTASRATDTRRFDHPRAGR